MMGMMLRIKSVLIRDFTFSHMFSEFCHLLIRTFIFQPNFSRSSAVLINRPTSRNTLSQNISFVFSFLLILCTFRAVLAHLLYISCCSAQLFFYSLNPFSRGAGIMNVTVGPTVTFIVTFFGRSVHPSPIFFFGRLGLFDSVQRILFSRAARAVFFGKVALHAT